MRRIASLILITGCAGHYKTEHVGSGITFVAARGAAPATSPGVELPAGDYELQLRFDVPRAQLVEWSVTCPGAASSGSVGESFDSYRTRRIAQLRADHEHDRKTAASITSAVVGAFAPTVTAQARTSNGSSIDARVSGQAVGDAAGTAVANSMDLPVELPPGDVGAARVTTRTHVTTTAPGACAVTAVADDANVIGGFDVVRVRDLDAEARARALAEREASLRARAELSAQLVTLGADVTLRQRQAAAAAQAQAAAEARAGVELAARARAELKIRGEAEAAIEARHRAVIAIEVRRREVALDARVRVRAQLILWGADPELHARLELRAKQIREQREARLRIEIEARETREAQVRAELAVHERAEREVREAHEAQLRAQLEIREAHEREARARIDVQLALAERERMRVEAARLELAMRARTELRAYLVSIGARERPPMPAMIAEMPGDAPFAGAMWIAGHWTWSGNEWSWIGGGWRDTSVTFGAAGGEVAVGAVVEAPIAIEAGAMLAPVVTSGPARDHRTTTITVPAPSRDHRTTAPVTTPVTAPVRDHREPRHEPQSEPTVRDHRK